MSCNKDDDGIITGKDVVSLMDGSIIINNHPNVKITLLDVFPEGKSTTDFSIKSKSTSNKSTAADEPVNGLRGHDYRFKLVAEMSTLKVDGVEVQATHVKISDDGYAFVSYNERGEPHRGGVVVYKFTIHEGTLEKVKVDVVAVSSMLLRRAELSSLDYYNGKIYMTGASSESKLGYNFRKDGGNYAFFMVMELNPDKTFKPIDPEAVIKLTSFQGTAIRALNDKVYITTGDGTNNTKGGLYIYDANDYSMINFISQSPSGKNIEHARSVDVDDNYIYLMQANHARASKYDLNGNIVGEIYNAPNEAMQRDAKTEILAWDKYLFVAENESGLRMLFKDGSGINDMLAAPNSLSDDWDDENEVTNSVSLNSDLKKNSKGETVQSNLLLLANGERGVYWYDIMTDDDGKDWIISSSENSILYGTGSANFITSKGNIVFVADGLGGLKVLYIGFNSGDTDEPITEGCNDFMPYLFNGRGTGVLLPERLSVFSSAAHPIIKTLFSEPSDVPDYIEIINSTDLYISYMSEGADYHNCLGYFVIPASVPNTIEEEFKYYNETVKPNMVTTVGRRNILKDEYIIFKNVADVKRGGPLKAPNTYRIGNRKYNSGDRIVLFMVPEGWKSQNNNVEVLFTPSGGTSQLFFTHKGLNSLTNVPFDNKFANFKGIGYNTFYSVDCKSMVMFFEDDYLRGSDLDYNDLIFTISDNIDSKDVINFKLPKYRVSSENGTPKIE